MEPMNLDGGRLSQVFPKGIQDSLNTARLQDGGATLRSMPTVGDVPEILRQVAGPVWMPLHKPHFNKKSMKAMGKMVDSETNDGIILASSSLTIFEDWDLIGNHIFLEKLEHKVQKILSIPNQKVQTFCTCMKSFWL